MLLVPAGAPSSSAGADACGVFADGKEESLLDRRRQLSRELAQLGDKYERLVSRFPNLRFDYK